MKKKYSVGVDIGGSHISCALIDLENESIIKESLTEEAVDNKASTAEILGTWCGALSKTILSINKNDLAGIGFAMPGPFDYVKGIGLFEGVAKYDSLYGVDIAGALKKELNLGEEIPVRFINDATAFAIGEAWMGKAKGFKRSISITLGTGFGSAFIDDVIPVVDGDEVPGQGCVWHIKYKDGIADDYFSTRWFVQSYHQITGELVNGVKDIAERAAIDNYAKNLFRRFGQNLSEFLFPFVKKFGAQALVIGGNVSGAFPLFEHGLKSNGFIDISDECKIFISELKEEAALIGGAKLLDENYWQKVKGLLAKM